MSAPVAPVPTSSASAAKSSAEPPRVGRYELLGTVASGGMATVHAARLAGPVGFSRVVAIKRLAPALAADPDFVTMFLDEARLAALVHHPNVVPTLDVVASAGEVFVVMDYVHGESLARLLRTAHARRQAPPPAMIATLIAGVLHGLHAAHQARDAGGRPLELVHRDVSPQNILVGVDGHARIIDFGVAKATGRAHVTRAGEIKGKLAYLAPEQLAGQPVSAQTDIHAAGVVLREALHGASDVPPELLAIVARAVAKDPSMRWPSARKMALAIERVMPPTSASVIGDWVERLAHDALAERKALIARPVDSDSPFGPDELTVPGSDAVGERPAPPASPARIVSAVAVVGALVVVIVLVALSHGEAKEPARAATSSEASAVAQPSMAAETAPSSPAASPSPAPSLRREPAHRASETKKAVLRNCDPPYFSDSNGHRHYRAECL